MEQTHRANDFGLMGRIRALGILMGAFFLVLLMAAAKPTFAHPLSFESDLTEDEVITYCNQEGIDAAAVNAAARSWNEQLVWADGPKLRNVTGTTTFCEVRVNDVGGAQASYYARVVYTLHPDQLQLSSRYFDLTEAQQEGIIAHEFGHALGLKHPNANATNCRESIMPEPESCRALGIVWRTTPGPHDREDIYNYWVETPIYPIPGKCHTDVDSDGDERCDNYGPPAAPRTLLSAPTPTLPDVED